MARLAVALIVLVLPIVLSSGCGGSSDNNASYKVKADTTLTVASIGKPAFVNRVNKICRHGWHEVIGNFIQYSGWQSKNLSGDALFDKAYHLSLLAGLDFHIFDDIKYLGAPANQKGQAEKLLGTFQKAIELGARRDAHSIADVQDQFEDFNALAADYGVDDCLVDEAHLAPIER